MKALVYSHHPSDPAGLTNLEPNYPDPAPPVGSEVLVHITHAAIEPGEVILQHAFSLFTFLSRFRSPSHPPIPGLEYAGVISAAGPETAPEFRVPGTRVFGLIPLNQHLLGGVGTLAEFVKVDAASGSSFIEVMPESMHDAEAAALTGSGNTAMLLVKNANIRAGDVVLINGASGAVGTAVVQMCKAKGVKKIVAVCSAANEQFVKSLGSDKVIDYQTFSPLHVELTKRYAATPFNAICDTIGAQQLYVNCPSYLKPGGVYANVGAYAHGILWTALYLLPNWYLPTALGGVPRTYKFWSSIPEKNRNKKLIDLVENGQLKVCIDEVYAMEDAQQAFARVISKRARGKVVIKI